jgi:hypothetical protein
MLVQTTTKFDNSLNAQNSLRGLKDLPGFCIGYITEQNAETFEVITVFKYETANQPEQNQTLVSEAYSTMVDSKDLTPKHQTMLYLLDLPNPKGLEATTISWRDFARAILKKPSHEELLKTDQRTPIIFNESNSKKLASLPESDVAILNNLTNELQETAGRMTHEEWLWHCNEPNSNSQRF